MNENKKITVAIAGNPNSGKSTLFNAFTGANQHVGNYPGVTVEKKEGTRKYKGYEITFIDLPGTYSLSSYSEDERVARDFLIKEKPDMAVNVIDASNMERNLYLFTQLSELDVPVIIALNMVDILQAQGKIADEKALSSLLGVPVFSTVGNKEIGVGNILDAVISCASDPQFHGKERAKVDYGDDIKEETDKIETLMFGDKSIVDLSKKWIPVQLLNNDPFAVETVSGFKNKDAILEQAQKSGKHLEEHFSKRADVIIAERRYGFAKSVVKTVIKDASAKKIDVTEIIDRFVLNKYAGIPVFAAVMYAIFKFTFAASEPVVNLFGMFFDKLGSFARSLFPEGSVQSLVVDGIIGGVGGVLGFFPLVLFMFFAIAFFEDSGYMARAAFVMDKVMNKFGLHGKSFLPLMISTNGCAVPGFMATRTLDSKRDRFITMFALSFMICGAKLPIFALFIGAFFPERRGANIMFLMYLLSICIALGASKLLSKTVFKGEPAHFVIELPPYHLPTIKGLLLKMWERGWLYIRKAGTIIMLASVIMWAGFAYPKAAENPDLSEQEYAAVQIETSIFGQLSKFLAPAVKPIGMDGSIAIALVSGLAAKEIVVSTLGTIYSLEIVDSEDAEPLKEKIAADPKWSPLKAMTFLIFCMIYMPCFAAATVFFRETGSNLKWLALMVIGNTAFAWIAAFLVFQIGTLLKIGV
ncbi:MAG: ferrous iron transport protein B [Endomicrobium sp.]|jgi:ferrous iron transport protein B|nr:ferrous iron transport protein B [Endomicrobium sp.]